MFAVKQLQIKNRVRQPKNEWCTRARQHTKGLFTGVKELPIENLCIGDKHLPLEDFGLGLDNS